MKNKLSTIYFCIYNIFWDGQVTIFCLVLFQFYFTETKSNIQTVGSLNFKQVKICFVKFASELPSVCCSIRKQKPHMKQNFYLGSRGDNLKFCYKNYVILVSIGFKTFYWYC